MAVGPQARWTTGAAVERDELSSVAKHSSEERSHGVGPHRWTGRTRAALVDRPESQEETARLPARCWSDSTTASLRVTRCAAALPAALRAERAGAASCLVDATSFLSMMAA